MDTPTYTTVDEYLDSIPEPHRTELLRIRQIVKEFVPDATESISYGMPAFKYKKKPLLYYAAFKDHLSLFPTAGPTEALKDELASYETSKGTIRFSIKRALPKSLICTILRCRIAIINKES